MWELWRAARGHWGSGGEALMQPPNAGVKAPSLVWKQEGLGAKSPAMGDFCNFSKITHFSVFMHISAKIINFKHHI